MCQYDYISEHSPEVCTRRYVNYMIMFYNISVVNSFFIHPVLIDYCAKLSYNELSYTSLPLSM